MPDIADVKEIFINKLKNDTYRLIAEIGILFLSVMSAVAVQIKYELITEPEQPEPVTQFFEGNFGEILDIQLKRAGVEAKSRTALEYAVSKKIDVRKLNQKDRFEFISGPEHQIAVFLLETADRRFLFTPDGEKYKSEEIKVNVDKRRHILKGTIKDSLWSSMSEAGLPPVVIVRFANIFRWTVDFLTDTRAGTYSSRLCRLCRNNRRCTVPKHFCLRPFRCKARQLSCIPVCCRCQRQFLLFLPPRNHLRAYP